MNVCTQLPACAQASQPACRMYLVHCSSGTPSADTMHNEQHDGTKLLWFSRGSRAGTRGASLRTRCDERAPASPVAACAAAAAPASMRHSSSRACSRSTVSPARPSRSGSSAASHRSAKGTLERAPAARRAHPTVSSRVDAAHFSEPVRFAGPWVHKSNFHALHGKKKLPITRAWQAAHASLDARNIEKQGAQCRDWSFGVARRAESPSRVGSFGAAPYICLRAVSRR